LAPVIAAISGEIARHGNFNYLLSNGEVVFSHCSSKLHVLSRQHPFPKARLVDCNVPFAVFRCRVNAAAGSGLAR
jgi:glutamine amidotransferase